MEQRRRAVLKTHFHDSAFNPRHQFYRRAILEHLLNPLLADIGRGSDITTAALLPSSKRTRAVLIAQQEGVLAGMHELKFFLGKSWAKGSERKIFGRVIFLNTLDDSVKFKSGAVVAQIEGSVADILMLERTILNFLQHMSGVATLAHRYVEQIEKHPVLVCSTRKTPWGLLDKKACVVGGAGTHRLDLSDAILVKDTHLDFLGHNFDLLREKLIQAPSLGRFVEIEVESVQDGRKAIKILSELQQLRAVPCVLMLDNMKPEKMKEFIWKIHHAGFLKTKPILIEASGGITLKNIQEYAKTGVDILSVGAMTHSAPAVDISLKILSG